MRPHALHRREPEHASDRVEDHGAWTAVVRSVQYRGMHRSVVLCLALSMSACVGDPASLGITGPAGLPPPPVVDPTLGLLAPPEVGTQNGPEPRPATIGSRYWGYN